MPVISLPNGQTIDVSCLKQVEKSGRDTTCLRTTFGSASYVRLSLDEIIQAGLQQGVDLRRYMQPSRLMSTERYSNADAIRERFKSMREGRNRWPERGR